MGTVARAVAITLGLAAAGCVTGTQREGRGIDPAAVLKLKAGITTKQEVLDLFGPPTAATRALAGGAGAAPLGAPVHAAVVPPEDIYTYEYRQDDERFFTAVLLYTYFERVKLADTLMVVFGPMDLVKYVAYRKQTDAEPPKGHED